MEQQHSKHLLMTQFQPKQMKNANAQLPLSRYKDQVSKCVYAVTKHMVVMLKRRNGANAFYHFWCSLGT